MIIVSQDKRKIADFSKADIKYDGLRWVLEVNRSNFAEYRTVERAKEILQEIIDAYHHRLDVYEMPER